ncbi:MAG: hypothetical protein IJO48_05680, partial [Clostridia bacterium]|nr:hypothetical protein [Clostridia bacterium]
MKEKGVLSLRCLDFPIVRNGAGLGGKPVGTGAYQVETYSNDKVVLAANENWWKQRPYIDRVEFEARDSNETALASFAAGQFNMVPTSAITAGRYRQEGVSEVLDVMTQDMEVLIVNHDNYILRDVRIRQAVAYMIDRSEIISNVCMNRAQACDVPIAPDSWFYDSKSKVYDHSLNKAMSLLEEAGYTDADENGVLEKNGIELELNILVCESADGTRGEAAREIAKQLTDAGIKAQVVIAAYSMNDGGEFMSKLKNGEFDLALVGFNMSRDCDLSPYLDEMGECNYGGYHGSELAELAHAMYTASDEASLRESASAFQSKFVSQLPFIVLYFRLNSIVCSADIRDIGAVREPDIMRNAEKWYIAESEQNGAE